jgi:hypothetical protein
VHRNGVPWHPLHSGDNGAFLCIPMKTGVKVEHCKPCAARGCGCAAPHLAGLDAGEADELVLACARGVRPGTRPWGGGGGGIKKTLHRESPQ